MTGVAFLEAGLLEKYFGTLSYYFERSACSGIIEHQSMRHPASIMLHRRERAQRDGISPASVESYYRPSGGETTVEITGDECVEQGYTPTREALEQYGEASRRFHRMEPASPVIAGRVISLQFVCQCYFGDLGAQHARNPNPGRIGALYHLTAAGQELLAMELRAHGSRAIVLSAEEQMFNVVGASPSRAATTTPGQRLAYSSAKKKDVKKARQMMLARAYTQAMALLVIASARWNAEAKRDKADDEQRKRLREAGRVA